MYNSENSKWSVYCTTPQLQVTNEYFSDLTQNSFIMSVPVPTRKQPKATNIFTKQIIFETRLIFVDLRYISTFA